MFIDRDGYTSLVDNMKETLSVEKWMLALAKKGFVEEKKPTSQSIGRVTFKEDEKKKNIAKDAFDME